MIAPLSAVNEVAELRAAATVLEAGDHLDRMLGRLLACIAGEWAATPERPGYAGDVRDIAACVVKRSQR